MSNVRLVCLSNGDTVLTSLKFDFDNKTVTMENPVVIIPTHSNMSMMAYPMFSVETKDITVPQSVVLFDAEPDAQLVEAYQKKFGKIITPNNNFVLEPAGKMFQ